MQVPCMTKCCGAYTIVRVAKKSKINRVCLKATNLYRKRQSQLRSTPGSFYRVLLLSIVKSGKDTAEALESIHTKTL